MSAPLPGYGVGAARKCPGLRALFAGGWQWLIAPKATRPPGAAPIRAAARAERRCRDA
jgi:hypothetical protein